MAREVPNYIILLLLNRVAFKRKKNYEYVKTSTPRVELNGCNLEHLCYKNKFSLIFK